MRKCIREVVTKQENDKIMNTFHTRREVEGELMVMGMRIIKKRNSFTEQTGNEKKEQKNAIITMTFKRNELMRNNLIKVYFFVASVNLHTIFVHLACVT